MGTARAWDTQEETWKVGGDVGDRALRAGQRAHSNLSGNAMPARKTQVLTPFPATVSEDRAQGGETLANPSCRVRASSRGQSPAPATYWPRDPGPQSSHLRNGRVQHPSEALRGEGARRPEVHGTGPGPQDCTAGFVVTQMVVAWRLTDPQGSGNELSPVPSLLA